MDNIEILKAFMQENNLNQSELSKLLNKDISTISKYLSGDRAIPDILIASLDDYDKQNNSLPSENNILKNVLLALNLNQKELADLLDLSPNTISGWNEKMPKMARYTLELMLEKHEIKNKNSTNIENGDTVSLKSNKAIKMTAIEIKDNVATCIWFDSDIRLQKEKINLYALIKCIDQEA